MKVWGVNHQPSGRATKMRGRMIAVKDKRLGWRIQAWPRKRGSYQSERQQQWGEWFAAVSGYLRQPDAGAALWAKQQTDGTIFMPRDLLLKISAGRFWQIDMEDGTQLWSAPLMADQVQALLDSITSIPGSIIYRAPDGWRGLAPGAAGDVLTSGGDVGVPSWQAGGGGGGFAYSQAPTGATGSSAHACKVSYADTLVDLSLNGIWGTFNPTVTQTVRGVAMSLSGLTVIDVQRTASFTFNPTGSGQKFWGHFPTPLAVPRLGRVAFGMELVGATTTALRNLAGGGDNGVPFPTSQGVWNFAFFDGNPAISDVLTAGTSSDRMAGFGWSTA